MTSRMANDTMLDIIAGWFGITRRSKTKKPIHKKENSMITYFRGVAVPVGVDRNLERLRAAVARRVVGCAFDATPCTLGDAGCIDVACPDCICDRTHRDLLKEYLNKAEKENSMEEQIKAILKPGMVIQTVSGQFFLWIGGPRGEMYTISLRQAEREFDAVVLEEINGDSFPPEEINAVFADATFDAPAVRPSVIVALLNGKDPEFVRCVWKRPEPAKEMTVDEISKALGYKVKVVGNEKADD